ncbi:MAG: DNA adenine methylase [Phycisphaerales bacterium]|nr:DNA adenine methylase [Phycisphaerales bacterium]
MVKYIGSKRTLIPNILEMIESLDGVNSVVDYFSGTSRVGHALKAQGYQVIANDYASYAHCLARCYVQTDRAKVLKHTEMLVDEFNTLQGDPGYFTKTFCEDAWYFKPENGARVDAIRESIESKDLDPDLKAVMLVSLMEAADRVDSTTGVQMAYLKSWAPRAHNPLTLRVPNVLDRPTAGKCKATNLEAQDAAKKLTADLAYIDPPYNQHSYLGNYHIWESLVKWDKPETYGIANKRIDTRTRKSDFNSKPKSIIAMQNFIDKVRCPYKLVSFNNEGYLDKSTMESILAPHGTVHTIGHDYKRYVGAQIGIHNQSGTKVGKVTHLRNTEYLFLVTPHGVEWKGVGTPAAAVVA